MCVYVRMHALALLLLTVPPSHVALIGDFGLVAHEFIDPPEVALLVLAGAKTTESAVGPPPPQRCPLVPWAARRGLQRFLWQVGKGGATSHGRSVELVCADAAAAHGGESTPDEVSQSMGSFERWLEMAGWPETHSSDDEIEDSQQTTEAGGGNPARRLVQDFIHSTDLWQSTVDHGRATLVGRGAIFVTTCHSVTPMGNSKGTPCPSQSLFTPRPTPPAPPPLPPPARSKPGRPLECALFSSSIE